MGTVYPCLPSSLDHGPWYSYDDVTLETGSASVIDVIRTPGQGQGCSWILFSSHCDCVSHWYLLVYTWSPAVTSGAPAHLPPSKREVVQSSLFIFCFLLLPHAFALHPLPWPCTWLFFLLRLGISLSRQCPQWCAPWHIVCYLHQPGF